MKPQKAEKGCITLRRQYWFLAGLVDTVYREVAFPLTSEIGYSRDYEAADYEIRYQLL